ncbi:MAG: hypothetical protein KGH98_04410 [Candidatus Micrarchaeota archaeon]|nr:hypothetical protein [Candidatus Micrarchaeota archaeon]
MNGEEYDAERKLRTGLDSLIAGIDEQYGSRLEGEELLVRQLADIRLRNQLIDCIKDMVKCRKLAERLMDELESEHLHEVRVRINSGAVWWECFELTRV